MFKYHAFHVGMYYFRVLEFDLDPTIVYPETSI
jgi:hypothetical protein